METTKIMSLKEGDYKVFAEVFDTFWNKVYFYFLKQTKSSEDSKDLTQLAFIKLWKYRHNLSEEATLSEQIFRKTRQVFIDWLRHEHRMHMNTFAAESRNPSEIPASTEDIYQVTPDVLRVLKLLPPKRREVFELRYIYGYSYKQIAQLLGVSVKTVDNQLSKANQQLRKLIQVSIYGVISHELMSHIN